jgi:hypothetical protein
MKALSYIDARPLSLAREGERMNIWMQINITHWVSDFDRKLEGDIKSLVAIDGYLTDDDNESGSVIANVILTIGGDVCVIYADNRARSDTHAQEVIQETINTLRNICK